MSIVTLFAVSLFCFPNILVITGFIIKPAEHSRIVNGSDALDCEFPFVASLRSRNAHPSYHTCGCSIISSQWVLTAAHCLTGAEPSSIDIQYGVTEIMSSESNVATVERIIVHENFSISDNYLNDIALVRLSSPLKFDDCTNAVKLPKKGQVIEGGYKAVLTGWGLNASNGSIETHLQKVDLIIIPEKDCQKIHNNTIHSINICAGVPGGGKGQCHGDSGGPLLVNGEQVGIVSWSVKPCTIPPFPGISTNVAEYIDWIYNKTQGENDDIF